MLSTLSNSTSDRLYVSFLSIFLSIVNFHSYVKLKGYNQNRTITKKTLSSHYRFKSLPASAGRSSLLHSSILLKAFRCSSFFCLFCSIYYSAFLIDLLSSRNLHCSQQTILSKDIFIVHTYFSILIADQATFSDIEVNC